MVVDEGLHLGRRLTVPDGDAACGVTHGRATRLHGVEVPAVLDETEDEVEQRNQNESELNSGRSTLVAPSPHSCHGCQLHCCSTTSPHAPRAQATPLCVAEIR